MFLFEGDHGTQNEIILWIHQNRSVYEVVGNAGGQHESLVGNGVELYGENLYVRGGVSHEKYRLADDFPILLVGREICVDRGGGYGRFRHHYDKRIVFRCEDIGLVEVDLFSEIVHYRHVRAARECAERYEYDLFAVHDDGQRRDLRFSLNGQCVRVELFARLEVEFGERQGLLRGSRTRLRVCGGARGLPRRRLGSGDGRGRRPAGFRGGVGGRINGVGELFELVELREEIVRIFLFQDLFRNRERGFVDGGKGFQHFELRLRRYLGVEQVDELVEVGLALLVEFRFYGVVGGLADLRFEIGQPRGGDGLFVYESLLRNVVERKFLFRELFYHLDVVGVRGEREVLYGFPRVHLLYKPRLCGGFVRRLELRGFRLEFGFEVCGHFLGKRGDCGKAREYK